MASSLDNSDVNFTLTDEMSITLAGASAVFWSTATALSPMQRILNIRRTGSTGNLPSLPLVVSFTSCVVNLCYSQAIQSMALLISSVCSGALCLFYMRHFYAACEGEKLGVLRAQLGVVGVFLACMVGTVLWVAWDPETGTVEFDEDAVAAVSQKMGQLSCSLNLLLFASPMATIGEVLRTRDVSFIPTPLVVCGLFASFSWTCFGYLTSNDFLMLPNGVGFCLTVVQCLVVVYFALDDHDPKNWDSNL